MGYFVEKGTQLSPLQLQVKRNLDERQGSRAILCRHIGCNSVALKTFAEGAQSLTEEQQVRLSELLTDMNRNYWQNKPRQNGWTTDQDGNRKFVFGIE